jgi:two-component system, NarL family, nitrate/nitrite response regulator NarL
VTIDVTGGPRSAPEGRTKTKIACIDDHLLLANELAETLKRTGDYIVVLEGLPAETAEGIAEEIVRSQPDAVILDLDLNGVDGVDVLGLIKAELAAVRVLILTGSEDPAHVSRAIGAGAAGVVNKAVPISQVVAGIKAALSGRPVLGGHKPELTNGARSDRFDPKRHICSYLTPREREVLARVAAGQATTAIARDLSITVSTTRSHVQSILRKLGVHSKLAAAALAVQAGIVSGTHKPPPAASAG